MEFASAIRSTFEPVVQCHLYPRSQIDIYVQVLQQDGGILSASINATTLALISAGIPLFDYVCAITSGVHSTQVLLDLTTLEENDVPHLTVAIMPRTKKVTLVQLETRIHSDRFENIFRLACEAGDTLHREMRNAIRSNTAELVDAMKGRLPIMDLSAHDQDDDVDMKEV